MILGSECRFGVITEVTAQVHRLPAQRAILANLFLSLEAGLKAMQAISDSDATPSITPSPTQVRTSVSFATRLGP